MSENPDVTPVGHHILLKPGEAALDTVIDFVIRWFKDHFGHTDEEHAENLRSTICHNCAHAIEENRFRRIDDGIMRRLMVRGFIPAKNCRCSRVAREKHMPFH